ncbi:YwqG family protein [Massilia scottii]|uniref:YwqG family protein n=1 Tax=Massilia scottii TaxID=3057166 RepID=UPI002796D705|nr:YwqG family protein [Massilia sp. CCM 9029]MDQ1831026.1 YwqG family protein [Massilia sp. CCM 9029]
MNIDALAATIQASEDFAPLTAHLGYLRDIAQPCIEMRLLDGVAAASASRFGGMPMVPAGFVWPTHAVGQYRFLGQINFSDIASPSALPSTGVLSLFYASDEDGECFWGDPGYVVAYYWDDPDQLAHVIASDRNPGHSAALDFKAGISIPRHYELRDDWPFDEYSQEADRVFSALWQLQADDYLLGYPSFDSLAYDPTPEKDWVCLMTLVSHETLQWCWQDGAKLMVFIHKDKLKEVDFSELRCDAG